MRCKNCGREFKQNRKDRVFCIADCRTAYHRGTKSKWQKVIDIAKDEEMRKFVINYTEESSDG